MKNIKLFEDFDTNEPTNLEEAFNSDEAYLIILANPENQTEQMGFGNMKGYVVLGDLQTAYNKANELTNGEEAPVDMENPREFLGTTSVIKLVSNPSLEEGEILGSDLYDLVANGTENPSETVDALLNTLG